MPVLERIDITPSEQFVEELASQSLETNRIPDPYHYTIADSELFSPTAHCRIRDTVEDRTSHLGQLEYQAVVATEQWAARSDKGISVWVSPPSPGVYPVTKIIVSEIEYANGVKRLFNRAILFDFSDRECMVLAWNLTSFTKNKPIFTDLDQVRATPLVLDTKDRSWIEILERLIYDPKLWEGIRQGEDKVAKKKALEQARTIQKQLFFSTKPITYQEAQMAARQMIGSYPGSCPPRNSTGRTALRVFSENALTYVASSISRDPDYCRVCPICEKEINCVVKVGGSCPNCRAVKRCG
ncbi:hypothetical protein HYU45_00900 [Candidatus Daviesbacteria bacterium]|nr:hypothetical protein [Candidatus Daviesbacteria bacterium]